jgi:hypothetical protein
LFLPRHFNSHFCVRAAWINRLSRLVESGSRVVRGVPDQLPFPSPGSVQNGQNAAQLERGSQQCEKTRRKPPLGSSQQNDALHFGLDGGTRSDGDVDGDDAPGEIDELVDGLRGRKRRRRSLRTGLEPVVAVQQPIEMQEPIAGSENVPPLSRSRMQLYHCHARRRLAKGQPFFLRLQIRSG